MSKKFFNQIIRTSIFVSYKILNFIKGFYDFIVLKLYKVLKLKNVKTPVSKTRIFIYFLFVLTAYFGIICLIESTSRYNLDKSLITNPNLNIFIFEDINIDEDSNIYKRRFVEKPVNNLLSLIFANINFNLYQNLHSDKYDFVLSILKPWNWGSRNTKEIEANKKGWQKYYFKSTRELDNEEYYGRPTDKYQQEFLSRDVRRSRYYKLYEGRYYIRHFVSYLGDRSPEDNEAYEAIKLWNARTEVFDNWEHYAALAKKANESDVLLYGIIEIYRRDVKDTFQFFRYKALFLRNIREEYLINIGYKKIKFSNFCTKISSWNEEAWFIFLDSKLTGTKRDSSSLLTDSERDDIILNKHFAPYCRSLSDADKDKMIWCVEWIRYFLLSPSCLDFIGVPKIWKNPAIDLVDRFLSSENELNRFGFKKMHQGPIFREEIIDCPDKNFTPKKITFFDDHYFYWYKRNDMDFDKKNTQGILRYPASLGYTSRSYAVDHLLKTASKQLKWDSKVDDFTAIMIINNLYSPIFQNDILNKLTDDENTAFNSERKRGGCMAIHMYEDLLLRKMKKLFEDPEKPYADFHCFADDSYSDVEYRRYHCKAQNSIWPAPETEIEAFSREGRRQQYARGLCDMDGRVNVIIDLFPNHMIPDSRQIAQHEPGGEFQFIPKKHLKFGEKSYYWHRSSK